MDTEKNNKCGSNDLSKKNLKNLREKIFEFENQVLLNNDNKNEQGYIAADFNALIKILTQIKNLSVEENIQDIIKLSDAASVFINYINVSKYNFRDKQIQDIVKYLIHVFKSLYLHKEIEDFEVFVHYLNIPSKIFS